MDRDTELTAYLLRYLYDNHYFDTMEEMAVALDISKRQIQRLLNNVDSLKGGSIALSKILQYFGQHHIPFDPVLIKFFDDTICCNNVQTVQLKKPYLRLSIPIPENLTAEGVAAYEYYREFVSLTSSCICPNCVAWCNPWDGTAKLQNQHCFIAQLANSLLQSVAASYTKRT